MLDDQKKYKSALWISGVLPFVIFSCALFISEPTFSNVVGRAAPTSSTTSLAEHISGGEKRSWIK